MKHGKIRSFYLQEDYEKKLKEHNKKKNPRKQKRKQRKKEENQHDIIFEGRKSFVFLLHFFFIIYLFL